MTAATTTRLIHIGNSRGIRIPKLLLDQLKFSEEVELSVEQDRLIVRPVGRPRDGWDAQFKLMAERGDDRLLDGGSLNLSRWDNEGPTREPGGICPSEAAQPEQSPRD